MTYYLEIHHIIGTVLDQHPLDHIIYSPYLFYFSDVGNWLLYMYFLLMKKVYQNV